MEYRANRALARDRRYDGRFLIGVLTTRIYCLPSCPARSPKTENISFFRSPAEAENAGLRACMRCRPDLFYRGIDPDEEIARGIAELVRRSPASFRETGDLVKRAGVGATKLAGLFRSAFHLSPAAFLQKARAEYACRLLLEGAGSPEAQDSAGFGSSSVFHEAIRRRTGLTPAGLRRLGTGSGFLIRLPHGYRTDLTLGHYQWRGDTADRRVRGSTVVRALPLREGPATVALSFRDGAVRCEAQRTGAGADGAAELLRSLVAVLGLDADPGPFERRVRAHPAYAGLTGDRSGLRILRTASPFEGLVWTVLGQAISRTVALRLRGRLLDAAGRKAPGGLTVHPGPEDLCEIPVSVLRRIGLSRAKAETLHTVSCAVADRGLDPDALAQEPAGRIRKTLRRIRGIGPWSVEYLLLRAYGFEDCVPPGDAALAAGIRNWYRLSGTGNDPAEYGKGKAQPEREPLAEFAPYRSYATCHFWMYQGVSA